MSRGRSAPSPLSGIRAVIFDLYITLTDFQAERRRPHFAAALAESLGVDPDAFFALMRSTYDDRATGWRGGWGRILTTKRSTRQLRCVENRSWSSPSRVMACLTSWVACAASGTASA